MDAPRKILFRCLWIPPSSLFGARESSEPTEKNFPSVLRMFRTFSVKIPVANLRKKLLNLWKNFFHRFSSFFRRLANFFRRLVNIFCRLVKCCYFRWNNSFSCVRHFRSRGGASASCSHLFLLTVASVTTYNMSTNIRLVVEFPTRVFKIRCFLA